MKFTRRQICKQPPANMFSGSLASRVGIPSAVAGCQIQPCSPRITSLRITFMPGSLSLRQGIAANR
jgi:hypothetical protein